MNPTNELGLPPAPPLPREVRERALRAVLDELDEQDEQDRMGVTGRGAARRRWSPLLAAAAVVLVAIAVAVATTLTGARPDEVGPATGVPDAPSLTPRPDDVPPTGDPVVDAALARCAAAAAQDTTQVGGYPPARTWRVTGNDPTAAPLETRLLVNDWFACVTTPESVTLSPNGGRPAGEATGVAVAWMTPTLLFVYNPNEYEYTITGGPLREARYPGERVRFIRLDFPPVDGMRLLVGEGLRVGGDPLYDGPFPEPEPAVTVVDRPLPHPLDGPESARLADCVTGRPPAPSTHPELWVQVGVHDVALTVSPALIARIGDLYAGLCVQDPSGGPTFAFGPLPERGDQPEVVVRYRGGAEGVLLTVPAGVDRTEIAPATGPADGAKACTIVDGLAACTLDGWPGSGQDGRTVSVTAFTAADPQGVEVYRG